MGAPGFSPSSLALKEISAPSMYLGMRNDAGRHAMRIGGAVLAAIAMWLGGGIGCDQTVVRDGVDAQADPAAEVGEEPASPGPNDGTTTTPETASLDYDGAVRVTLTRGGE